jgi:hypothetical protein
MPNRKQTPKESDAVKIFGVVLRQGRDMNQTLATIKYDRYGSKTNQEVIICTDWTAGFHQARQTGYQQILFVDSGTVFTDWVEWCHKLDNYPHRGLIAHIVWHPGQAPWLHEQCWFMDSDLIDPLEWHPTSVTHPVPKRSEKNIHDDYTPLYIKPGAEMVSTPVKKFGQTLISAQLNKGLPIVNWNQNLRKVKHYLYADNPAQKLLWQQSQQEYLDLAENQFWILNNERITLYAGHHQISPAAGLHWILNLCQPHVTEMDVIDISRTQIDFARHLWESWDGSDYGSVVADYIKRNQLQHFELDFSDISKMERLRFRNPRYLLEYVNSKFADLVPDNFAKQWRYARENKSVRFHRANIVDWVLKNGTSGIDSAWLSNVLDYKWTLLKSTADEIEKFKEMTNAII